MTAMHMLRRRIAVAVTQITNGLCVLLYVMFLMNSTTNLAPVQPVLQHAEFTAGMAK